ncbi:hypothetical protein AVEN_242000-1 [Araneus ventricosus]|uniref:Uncharacterized protein n=1 Tax=Araneus ventricosus TaxID=182803 RepID=A0A4Y2E9H6_ARAVE|nr:hypothetical protein AVEN_242000-1 [Araneus ventricosus]
MILSSLHRLRNFQNSGKSRCPGVYLVGISAGDSSNAQPQIELNDSQLGRLRLTVIEQTGCKKLDLFGGLKRHIVVHDDYNNGNSRNKRQGRSSSPQPGPSGLQSGSDGTRRRRSRTALNTFEVVKIFPSATVLKGFELFLNNSEKETIKHLEQKAREERGVRFYLNVKIRFVRSITETGKKYLEEHFRSKCETCLLDESPEEKVKNDFEKIKTSCEEFETPGRGWLIDKILFLEVNTCVYRPLSASTFIPIPSAIAKKKAVINIKNSDDVFPLVCVSFP